MAQNNMFWIADCNIDMSDSNAIYQYYDKMDISQNQQVYTTSISRLELREDSIRRLQIAVDEMNKFSSYDDFKCPFCNAGNCNKHYTAGQEWIYMK